MSVVKPQGTICPYFGLKTLSRPR